MNNWRLRSKFIAKEILLRVTRVGVARNLLHIMVRKQLIGEKIWSRLPVELTFEVHVSESSSFQYQSTAGDFIGRGLYWKGIEAYEYETVREFLRIAGSARTVIDIGANTGYFTLLACAANPDARVIALEPVPRIFALLRRNVELNGWTDRCELRQQAASSTTGTVKLFVPDGALPYSSSLNPSGLFGMPGGVTDVAAVNLDDELAKLNSIDLVKIDVEGFEHEVLSGMPKILAELTPAIILECNGLGSPDKLEAVLRPYGYQFEQITPGGLIAHDHLAPGSGGQARNFVCTVP